MYCKLKGETYTASPLVQAYTMKKRHWIEEVNKPGGKYDYLKELGLDVRKEPVLECH